MTNEAGCSPARNRPQANTSTPVKAPLNIGVADPTRAAYLPIYRLRNIYTGDVVSTTDPGRAMITGRWTDIGKFKGPVLRALAARPPVLSQRVGRHARAGCRFL